MTDLYELLAAEPEPKPPSDGFQIGDILYSSWGYDQTNVSFYKIIARTPKFVTVLKLGAKTAGTTTSVADHKIPTDIVIGEKPIRRKIILDRYINLNDWTSAYPWDGTPKYQTPAGMGH